MPYTKIIQTALKEDAARNDLTSKTFIPKNLKVKAVIIAKEDAFICGLKIARQVFQTLDKRTKFFSQIKEGGFAKKGQVISRIEGNAQAILAAERTALNFLSFLSGIATRTKKYLQAVKPYKVRILDTRKTLPGLRKLEKYAVRVAGGYNHRMSLDQLLLLKDNHLKIVKINSLPKFRQKAEIEVKNLSEFKQALKLNPAIIMLDNLSIKEIKKAVQIRNKLNAKSLPKLEASGGITLKNIRKIAACGVEMISIGELTHSVKSVDMSLEII